MEGSIRDWWCGNPRNSIPFQPDDTFGYGMDSKNPRRSDVRERKIRRDSIT